MPMPLNIIVPIKWIPNTSSVNIDPKTGTLIRTNVPSIINPPDLNAIEAALRLRDKYGGMITAMSMSPPSALLGLEHAIGMGVDKAYLLTDRTFAGADTLATSYTLAKAIEKIGEYDLIITGQETLDSSTAHIGAQIASWLNLPFIYYAKRIEYDQSEHAIIVERELEESVEKYAVKLPAVISTAIKSNKPRHVRLKYKIRAKREKPIIVWTNRELGLDPNCVGLKGSPTIVAKIEFMGRVPRKNIIITEGSPEEKVEKLLEKLIKDKVLSEVMGLKL